MEKRTSRKDRNTLFFFFSSVSKDSFYKHQYINRKKKKAYFKEVANPMSLEKNSREQTLKSFNSVS